MPERRKPCRRPNNFAFPYWPVRANAPAGRRIVTAACGPLTRIGFAPETIAPSAICRAFLRKDKRMTAYLISLALLGLVAIVVAEFLS
jgi:hypothetical protein